MLEIKKNYDLSPHLTMKVGDKAKFFAVIKNREDFLEAVNFAKQEKIDIFILGGGSNTIITKTLKSLVLKNEIKGMVIKKETKTHIFLEVMSGESWMKLVNYSVNRGLYGLENLASIYGTVGAAPIQNIGAYGAEFSQVFDSLLALDLKTAKEKIFKNKDCNFGYRSSVFKGRYKNRFFIYSLTLKLKKKANLHLNYGSIAEELEKKGIKKPSPKNVADLVNSIRAEKLPNPAILPNSGSFFKNPEIKNSQLKKIQINYPDIPVYPSTKKGMVKISAGWLIEKAGLKGKRFINVGMYEKQALILVNYGGAQAKDIIKMINRVKKIVKDKFSLDLEEEVNVL